MEHDNQSIYFSSKLYLRSCSACSLGINEFAECLVTDAQICQFALPFGFGYLCFHPQRNKIIEHTIKKYREIREEK